jgi:PIN domain nuclease of toxin-antitoxin system
LLDTHAFIWFLSGDRRLSHKAQRVIEDGRNTIYASAAVAYELSYKRDFGSDTARIVDEFDEGIRRGRFEELPVSVRHATAAAELPNPHKDPWDRLLMAQAKLEDLIMVTRDGMFEEYGVKTLW